MKRGWLRIVEASVAVIIILSVLFVVYQRQTSIDAGNFDERVRSILDEAAQNETIRRGILTSSSNAQGDLDSFVRSRLPESSLNFEARICGVNDACGKSNYTSSSVYAVERIFAAFPTSENIEAKKVRLFVWRGQ